MIELAANGKTIKALENRPILSPGLDVYMSAFNELQFDRPAGFTVGYIPWSSIIKWCNVHQIHDIDDIDVFIRHIRALEKADAEISDRKKKQSEAKTGAK